MRLRWEIVSESKPCKMADGDVNLSDAMADDKRPLSDLDCGWGDHSATSMVDSKKPFREFEGRWGGDISELDGG